MNQPVSPPTYEQVVSTLNDVQRHGNKLLELFRPLETAQGSVEKAKAMISQIGTPRPDDDSSISQLAMAEKKLQIGEAAVTSATEQVVAVLRNETAALVERAGRIAAEVLYYAMLEKRNAVAADLRKHCQIDEESHELAAQTSRARGWNSQLQQYLDARTKIDGNPDRAAVMGILDSIASVFSERARSVSNLGRFLN